MPDISAVSSDVNVQSRVNIAISRGAKSITCRTKASTAVNPIGLRLGLRVHAWLRPVRDRAARPSDKPIALPRFYCLTAGIGLVEDSRLPSDAPRLPQTTCQCPLRSRADPDYKG